MAEETKTTKPEQPDSNVDLSASKDLGAVDKEIKPEDCNYNLLTAFECETKAFAINLSLLAILSIFYIIVSFAWSNETCISDRNSETCTLEKPWDGAITLRQDGFFKLQINEPILKRFFAPAKITDLEKDLQKQLDDFRPSLYTERKFIVLESGKFIRRTFSRENTLPIFQTNTPTNSSIENASLSEIAKWMEGKATLVPRGKKANFNALIDGLRIQEENEKAALEYFQNQTKSLEAPLSFFWLYHSGSGWVFEMVVWSLFGVLINTLAGIMKAAKTNDYIPRAFAMTFPKFFIAPVVSIVLAAVWMTGFSQSEVLYYNMPYFLLFAFITGFASERSIEQLRKLVNHVMKSTEWDPDRERAANVREDFVISYQNLNETDLPKSQTLIEALNYAREIAKAQARKIMIEDVAKGGKANV